MIAVGAQEDILYIVPGWLWITGRAGIFQVLITMQQIQDACYMCLSLKKTTHHAFQDDTLRGQYPVVRTPSPAELWDITEESNHFQVVSILCLERDYSKCIRSPQQENPRFFYCQFNSCPQKRSCNWPYFESLGSNGAI